MRALTIATALLGAALALFHPSAAPAQAVANAEIRGVISDSSGAWCRRRKIKATQTETGQVRTTLSGSDGSYVLPNLPVGPYKLEVSAPSFT